jgi:hypothetical protein
MDLWNIGRWGPISELANRVLTNSHARRLLGKISRGIEESIANPLDELSYSESFYYPRPSEFLESLRTIKAVLVDPQAVTWLDKLRRTIFLLAQLRKSIQDRKLRWLALTDNSVQH